MSDIKVSVHDSLLEQNRLHLDEMARRLELEQELESLKKSYNAVWKLFEQGELKLDVVFRHLFPEIPPEQEPYINEEWDRMIKRIDDLVTSKSE